MRWLKLSLWLAFMAGCSTPVAETPKVPQVRTNVAGLMPPLPQASAARPRQGFGPGAPPTSQIATQRWALAWDPSPSTDVAGYNVYFGPVSHTYTNMITAGNATNLLITPSVLLLRFYAVTAYNSAGLESDLSKEIEFNTLQDRENRWLLPTNKASSYSVQMSTNLRTWQAVSPPVTFTASNAFYRLRVQ